MEFLTIQINQLEQYVITIKRKKTTRLDNNIFIKFINFIKK